MFGFHPSRTLHSERSNATMGAYGRARFVVLCTVYILKLASYDNIAIGSTISASGKSSVALSSSMVVTATVTSALKESSATQTNERFSKGTASVASPSAKITVPNGTSIMVQASPSANIVVSSDAALSKSAVLSFPQATTAPSLTTETSVEPTTASTVKPTTAPSVNVINCTSLTVDPGGPLRMSSCGNHYGAQCNFSCTIGHRLNGSSTVTCVAPGNQHPGVWNNTIPRCEVITCPALPAPSNGTRLGCPGNATMYYDTVCQFSCNSGYIGSGSQVRRCQHNGTWSGQDFTCDVDGCKHYKVLNGVDRAQGNTFPPHQRCDSNLEPGWYRFQGAAGDRMADTCVSMLRCGTLVPGWLSGVHPTIVDGVVVRKVCYNWLACCGRSDNIKVQNCGSFFVYELKKPPSCNFRYCGNGSAEYRCPALPAPPNGIKFGCPENATVYNDTVCQFSCNDGYIGSGSQQRRCQRNGTWSGEVFTCQMITCPALPAPSNGTRLGCPGNATMFYDTVCQFSCNDGYIGSGSQARRCQHNGTWSGQDFTCQIVSCLALPSPPNSVRYGCTGNASEYPYDTVCRFSCIAGYNAIGSSVRRCQQNGLWSGGEFSCQAICEGCDLSHGSCIRPNRCVCQNGWKGPNCTECEVYPGCRHGTCNRPWQCNCISGWYGLLCDLAICEGCDLSHGSCAQPNRCECQNGWKGPNCTECEVYPACLHGTCNKSWECNCISGWGGPLCDLDLEYCARQQPCNNGATCTNIGPGRYDCKCKKGYTGQNCDKEPWTSTTMSKVTATRQPPITARRQSPIARRSWTGPSMSRKIASRKPPAARRNVECGKRKAGSKIVGGTDAQPGSWPWQVLLDSKEVQGPVSCGGSILTPYWIVTAAHCFDYGKNPTAFTVTVGEHDLRKVEGTEQTIPIDKIILHPKYKPSVTGFDYDVALIKLKKPIKFNSNVRPVCLPTMDFAPGTNCYVTGWGETTEEGNIAQILQQAEVPLVSRDTCLRAYNFVTKRMRCAGLSQGGVDSCGRDSGGPLVCPSNNKWYLMGVVSFGAGCALPNFFGVYSDMLVLKTWVQDTINKNPTP